MNTKMDTKTEILGSTVIEVSFETGEAMLVRTKQHGRADAAFILELFCLVAWKEEEEHKNALFHQRHGTKPTFAGEPLKRLRFERGIVDTIVVETAAGKLVAQKLLRLSFFALTDLGAIIVSMYPQMKEFSREMVMLSSHRPKHVALAQHFAASWMKEVYYRMMATK